MVRTSMLVALLLAGCRFNPSGLPASSHSDGPVDLSIAQELSTDLSRWHDQPLPDWPPDGPRPDAWDSWSPDMPVVCNPPCSGTSPICVSGTCQPCKNHKQCPGGLCALDGSCPASGDVAHVTKSGQCPGSGTKASPFCSLTKAVASGRPYVLLTAGTYDENVTLNKPQEIHGKPGAILKPSACDKLLIDNAKVTLVGFTIQGNIKVNGASAEGGLFDNTIGGSSCTGVLGAGGATVTMERNLVVSNTGGGVFVAGDYFIRNNIIVKNGNSGLNWGGVKLEPSIIANCRFVNNTVANNETRANNDKEAGGVRCEVANTPLMNSILWGNTPSDTDQQYSPNCVPSHCDFELQSGSAVAPNLSVNPMFIGGSDDTKDSYYHLQNASPVKNKGNPNATSLPLDDYDGDPRSDGLPDIGADEI